MPLKRSSFRRPVYEPAPAAPLKPLLSPPNYGPAVLSALPKETTYRSEKWLAAVRALEYCVLCGRHGAVAAHRNEGKSMAAKVDDCLTAALCTPCHEAIDSGKGLEREERRARIDSAILLTLVKLARKGVVKV
jgi:hypothetical protein